MQSGWLSGVIKPEKAYSCIHLYSCQSRQKPIDMVISKKFRGLDRSNHPKMGISFQSKPGS